ncbi:Protein of unknown function [Gryllus bimaculatus]|nr:Protein of unknown function [Gryllus bimaculatus]
MSDSDDEIFWGPVTVRELQIISRQIFSTDGQENKKTQSESKKELSQELNIKEISRNENSVSEDCMQSENFHGKGDEIAKNMPNSEFDLLDQDVTSNVTDKLPEIVISDFSNREQADPCTITTITSAISERDRVTDDGYDSAIIDSFIQENDSVSKGSDILLQSTEAHKSVMSPSNLEVYLPVSSENIVSSPKEKHSSLKDDAFQHSRTHSNDVSIEHDSSSIKVSANATYNSTKFNISNHQSTFVLHDGNEDSCKSTCADISSSPFLTTDCSVNTHLSKSVESSLSNDYNSMSFQFTMVSLNCSESQLPNDEAVHERKRENCQDLASFSNFEAFSNGHESVLSNLISDVSSQSVSKENNANLTTCLSDETYEHSIKDNHVSSVFENPINDKSSNVDVHADKVTVPSEHFYSSPIKNIACSSKIPVLQKTPSSASGSSKKKGINIESDSNECCGKGYTDYFPNHPFYIPEFPVSYDINTDNLVTRSPSGNIIPTACNGSSVHTSTGISANYVHVMTSEKISELAKNGFFMKSSPCAQDVPASSKRQSSEFEDSDLFDIEAENGSVLCSSSLTSSSSANSSLNGTLEEMEMMMKHGYEYMCGKDDLSLNAEKEGPQNNALLVTVPKPGPEKQPMQRGLKQCQYIRTSSEKMKSPFQKELNDAYADVARTPKFNSYAQKPLSAVCPRQLQRLKKTINFSNIRSPVGAYIKDRPVQLLKTCGKVKPVGRDDIPSRMYEKECVGSSAKQIPVKNASTLPMIVYEKAPGINVNPMKTTERCGPSKKNYTNPTVIKHAGRAVLATVPHNALQMIKNTEISVLYDKDVSKTATL